MTFSVVIVPGIDALILSSRLFIGPLFDRLLSGVTIRLPELILVHLLDELAETILIFVITLFLTHLLHFKTERMLTRTDVCA